MELSLVLILAISAVLGYLIGSVNSSILIIRVWKREEIREKGSKNAGLTNVLRVYGKKAALIILIADLLKGVVAVFLAKFIANLIGTELELIIFGYVAGIFVMIGHIFPIFYHFKGGKGVLIAATTLLAIDPITFCVIIPFFALILLITNYVSVASITAAIFYPITTLLTQYLRGDFKTLWINVGFAGLIGIIIVFMHRSNIKRLVNHEENKFRKNK